MKTISLELKVGLIAEEINVPRTLGVEESDYAQIAGRIKELRTKYGDDSKVLSNLLLELDDGEILCAFYMLGLVDGVETEKDAEKERKKKNGKTRKKAAPAEKKKKDDAGILANSCNADDEEEAENVDDQDQVEEARVEEGEALAEDQNASS